MCVGGETIQKLPQEDEELKVKTRRSEVCPLRWHQVARWVCFFARTTEDVFALAAHPFKAFLLS